MERDGQNSSHGRVFYGWRLRPQLSRKSMWVGFYPRAWADYGRSPLWVQIEAHADSGWTVPVLRSALRSLTLSGGPGVWEEGDFPDPTDACKFRWRNRRHSGAEDGYSLSPRLWMWRLQLVPPVPPQASRTLLHGQIALKTTNKPLGGWKLVRAEIPSRVSKGVAGTHSHCRGMRRCSHRGWPASQRRGDHQPRDQSCHQP